MPRAASLITRTMDGPGRVVLVHDSRTNAYVKTEYDACSCSPTGRQAICENPRSPRIASGCGAKPRCRR